MLAKAFLSDILEDEALTRGLGDPEARLLIEWLVEQADQLGVDHAEADEIGQGIKRLCRRARAFGLFVQLWCYRRERGAAIQLSAAERFTWPLPSALAEPLDVMQVILAAEAGAPSGATAGTRRPAA